MEFIRKNVNASSGTSSTSSGGGYSNVSNTGNTTLETHTIFGLDYNGTNDVRGDLSDVDKITANGDISTDGDLIIKGKDDDGTYNNKNLKISKDTDATNFTGGESYVFDANVTAPKFIGDVDADNADITSLTSEEANINNLTASDITSAYASILELLSGKITVDNLTVTKAAHFFSLIIDEIKSVGGLIIISPANATIDKVKVTDSGNYKCYFLAKVGDKQISNLFAANDLVVCQTFNVAEGTSYDVSNTFYWRIVNSRGKETIDNIDYHYIILSGTDCATDSGIPKEGDKVVTLGNRNTKDRLNAIVISAYNSEFLDSGIKAPSIVLYSGINDYTLSTHRLNIISNGLNELIGNLKVTSGETVTDLIDGVKYDRIILDKGKAIVTTEDNLSLDISGSILDVADLNFDLSLINDIGGSVGLKITNNTFSYTSATYQKKYSTLEEGKRVTKLFLQLRLNTTVVDSVLIPITFDAGAIFEVRDDAIESAVSSVSGDISRIELKADSVTATVTNMKVGGLNLLEDTEFSTYGTGSIWTAHGGTATKVNGYMNLLGVHNISKPSNVTSSGYLELAQLDLVYKLKPGTSYTFSFYAKGINGTGSDGGTAYKYKGRVTTYVYPNVGADVSDNAKTFYTNSTWTRYQYTFTTKADLDTTETYHLLFRLISDTVTASDGTTTTYYSNSYICMPKLEEGTMATAWDSSTEDIKSQITQTASSIEAKIVSEDTINSLISQSKTDIKAEVYNEMNEATGIDITNGSITLNANKTTINGNLNIRNADEGLILYDSDGNAKVMVVNKDIPTVSNLDTSESLYHLQIGFSEDLNEETDYEFDADFIALGTFKVNDYLKIDGSTFALYYKDASGLSKGFVPLNSSRYYEYSYWIQNTTTGSNFYSSVYLVKTTGKWDTSGNVLKSYSLKITEAGNYRVSMVVHLLNPDTTVTYKYGLLWCFFTDKTISEYTMIGSDGLVSVKGENQYLYFGDDGFIVRGNDYAGIKVGDLSNVYYVMATDSNGNALWGNFNSTLSSVNGPAPITYNVVTGGTSLGSKKVLRVDTTYYDVDIIVLKNLSAEVWIKLPTTQYTVDGKTYSSLNGKSLKIKNLTSQKCYVYVEDSGYKIYPSGSASGAYYQAIGTTSTEMIFTGAEWIIFD